MNDLDRWAHQFGYSDFDTFVRAGGSFAEARDDIRKRIRTLEAALKALPANPSENLSDLIYDDSSPAKTSNEILQEWQTDALTPDTETPDPDNAQIQGAEHP